MTDRDAILRQVLEIVDTLEKLHNRTIADILRPFTPEERRLVFEPMDMSEFPNLRHGKTVDEFLKRVRLARVATEVDAIRACAITARGIGDTIRKKFGLPAKED
jgi:hypothetical protein